MNAVRSPMAAALLRHLVGNRAYVESAGVRAGTLDPLAVEAMEEIGLEIAGHRPRRFEDLEDGLVRPCHHPVARGPAQGDGN